MRWCTAILARASTPWPARPPRTGPVPSGAWSGPGGTSGPSPPAPARRRAPRPGAMPSPAALLRAAPSDLFTRLGTWIDRFRAWVRSQPRGVQRAAGVVGVLFAINLLFNGIATPWFLVPALPFAIYIWVNHRRAATARAGVDGDGDVKW